MTSKERIAEIEKDLWKFEVTPCLGFSIIAEDARFLLDHIAKTDSLRDDLLASMKTMRQKLANMSVYYWQDSQQALIVVADAAIAKAEKTE